MELDHLHARILAFLTAEFSLSNWTPLKDASRCCITIVKTEFLLRFSQSDECEDVKVGLPKNPVPPIKIESNPSSSLDTQDLSLAKRPKILQKSTKALKKVSSNQVNSQIHELKDVKVLLTPLDDDLLKKTLEPPYEAGRAVRLLKRNYPGPCIRSVLPEVDLSQVEDCVSGDSIIENFSDGNVSDANDDCGDDPTFDPGLGVKGESNDESESENAQQVHCKKKTHFSAKARSKNVSTGRRKKLFRSETYVRIIGTDKYCCLFPGCKREYTSPGACHLHFMKVHKNVDYSKKQELHCSICSKRYFTPTRLQWHMDTQHPETIPADSNHICDVCAKLFSTYASLRHHRYAEHIAKKINYFRFCRVCHKSISKTEDLPADVIINNDSEDYSNSADVPLHEHKAGYESQTFRWAMVRHFTVHHPEELIVCTYDGCNKKFVLPSRLTIHVKLEHQDASSLLPCKYCDKKFRKKEKLSFHVDAIHPERRESLNFVCKWPDCGKAFSTSSNLKCHVGGHEKRERGKVNGVTPRKECKICGVCLAPTYLSLHMQTAHGTKSDPVTCPKCGILAKSDRSLKQHVKKEHSGIVYICDNCSKTFKTKESLNIHIHRVHEKITHQCQQCTKVYSARKELMNHVRAVHRGIKFACRMCNREFLRGPDRNRHEKQIHKVDPVNQLPLPDKQLPV